MHTHSIIPMYVPMHTPFTPYLLFRIYDSQINHAWNCFPLWVGVWMVTYTVFEWNIDSVYQSFCHLKLIYANHLYSINSRSCCPEIICPQYIPLYCRWSPSRFCHISLWFHWNPVDIRSLLLLLLLLWFFMTSLHFIPNIFNIIIIVT